VKYNNFGKETDPYNKKFDIEDKEESEEEYRTKPKTKIKRR
jgi:hypothetical protein